VRPGYDDGGAIYLHSWFIQIFFSGCLFDNCSAPLGDSGAAFVVGRSFSMSETSAVSCWARFNSFFRLSLYQPDGGSVEVRELSAAYGNTTGPEGGTVFLMAIVMSARAAVEPCSIP
jgi:hypothetical protein